MSLALQSTFQQGWWFGHLYSNEYEVIGDYSPEGGFHWNKWEK